MSNAFNENHDVSNELNDALREKLVLLQEFCRLSVNMLDSISREDFDRVNEIIEARAQVIEKAGAADEIINTLESRCGATESDCMTEQVRSAIREALQQAKDLDGKIKTALEESVQEVTRSIKALRAGRRAVSVYEKKTRQINSYFIDKKK